MELVHRQVTKEHKNRSLSRTAGHYEENVSCINSLKRSQSKILAPANCTCLLDPGYVVLVQVRFTLAETISY
jgi:hypothetical protein